MKKIILSGMVAITAVVASSSAYSVPGNGTQVVPFKTTNDYAIGSYSDGVFYTDFSAQSYDDNFGLQAGVEAQLYDYSTALWSYITCSGPAFASAVSVSQGGNVRVNATLDPSDTTNCSSLNVFAPVTINVSGQYDGNYKNSNTGTGKSTYYGTNYKYNSIDDNFSESFTGTTGLYTGTFTGYADSSRYTNLTKEK